MMRSRITGSAERERHGIADWQPDIQRAYDMTVGFWRLTKPTIAAVHKYCLAGATELALSCDITIASEGTRFGEPELRFGAGIAVMVMPWLTGPKKAKQWLLTGNDRIDATEAYQWGMINEVVPEGEHLETALAMARQIALMDPQAVRITKQAINRSFDIMGDARRPGYVGGDGVADLCARYPRAAEVHRDLARAGFTGGTRLARSSVFGRGR